MRSVSAVDRVCVHIVINAVTVAVSVAVEVSVAAAVANRHISRTLLVDCCLWPPTTFCSDLALQTTINPNSTNASLTHPPPAEDQQIKFNNNNLHQLKRIINQFPPRLRFPSLHSTSQPSTRSSPRFVFNSTTIPTATGQLFLPSSPTIAKQQPKIILAIDSTDSHPISPAIPTLTFVVYNHQFRSISAINPN
jgi:hypothetical protein